MPNEAERAAAAPRGDAAGADAAGADAAGADAAGADTSHAVAVYIEPFEGAQRDAIDDRLAALDPSMVVVRQVVRPQQADVILLADNAPMTIEAALAHSVPVIAVSDARGDVVRARAAGYETRLGLETPPLQWAETLRWLGAIRQARRALNAARSAYRSAVRASGAGGFVWQLGANTLRFDPAWKAMLGYTDEEITDDAPAWFTRVHAADRPRLRAALDPLLRGTARVLDLEHRIQHRDRSYLWVRTHAEVRNDALGLRIEGTQVDVTARKVTEKRLAYADRHDRLTGALSRHAFLEALQSRLNDPDAAVAVGLCDVDDLKQLNNRWGRQGGDDVLVWLAGLFEDRVGEGGLFGRVGSDAFAFVVEGDDTLAQARLVADLRDELLQERFLGPHGDEFVATATFAIAGRPRGVDDATDLLRLVDRGIDQARRAGEGVLVVTPETGALAFAPTLVVATPADAGALADPSAGVGPDGSRSR